MNVTDIITTAKAVSEADAALIRQALSQPIFAKAAPEFAGLVLLLINGKLASYDDVFNSVDEWDRLALARSLTAAFQFQGTFTDDEPGHLAHHVASVVVNFACSELRKGKG